MTISCQKEKVEKNQNPNIIYILADDMGYGDVSYLNENSKIKTPNIDQLASQGMSFTDAHSGSAVCTPTRYGILTGRYAWRTSMKQGVLWSHSEALIDPKRETVASMLKKNGYQTACVGKWHLGLNWAKDSLDQVQYAERIGGTPNDNGFDESYIITASLDIPPYFYIKDHYITASSIDSIDGTTGQGFWRKGPIGNDFKHEEVLFHLADQAVDYVNRKAKGDEPFFLYFPLPAPHTPILPSEKFKGKSGIGAFGDFVLMVDDVVKQIMDAVEKNGITDNTIIIFTSDNGVTPKSDIKELSALGHQSSYEFRGHKADIFEGGHRIPFIVKWPDEIKAGTFSNETTCLTDLMATMGALVDQEIANNSAEDSYSFLPVLKGEKIDGTVREATVHHSINGTFSIRQGKWKLIFGPGSGGWSDPKPKRAREEKLPLLQLYDLQQDIAEKNNVAKEHPELVKDLTKLMKSYVDNGRSTPGENVDNDTETTFMPKPYEL